MAIRDVGKVFVTKTMIKSLAEGHVVTFAGAECGWHLYIHRGGPVPRASAGYHLVSLSPVGVDKLSTDLPTLSLDSQFVVIPNGLP